MEEVFTHGIRPIKSWAKSVERGALEQAVNLANLPFAFKHIALMPDCHQGYGMPIGGVLATKDVIVPNAVGVDIGCGMCAVQTSLTARDLDMEALKRLLGGSREHRGGIRSKIPVGPSHHSKQQPERFMPNWSLESKHFISNTTIVKQEYESALKQIGTLGGGNHFIEIQKADDDSIWIMIHSGSRNLGYKVAGYYNTIAVEKNERWFSQVPKKYELAFLPLNTKEGRDYLTEMQYCVDFALANRRLMLKRIQECFEEIFPDILFTYTINIAHNYATIENHFGQNVWVHRKGATLARKGTVGIIPGAQGTASYIVKGLGNPESFQSCSHGAGRKLSRTQARRDLDLDSEKRRLDFAGIIHSIRNENDLDEATGAYKNIDEVMDQQKDLVEIVTRLMPLAVVKGRRR